MPRQARKLSEFGYMHLIIRGIGKQIMFEEEADYPFENARDGEADSAPVYLR